MTYSSKDEHKSGHDLTELICQSFSQFPHPEYCYSPLNGKPVHSMLPAPHPDSISSCFPNPLFVSIFTLWGFFTWVEKTRIVLTKSKDKFCQISKPSNSVSTWSVHKTGQHSFQRIPPPVSRIYSKLLKFSNPWVLQQKTIFAFLVNWFQFNYRLVVAFTTNDWQVFNGFVYLKNFVQFLRGINFFSCESEDLLPSAGEKVWCCLLNKMFSFL